MFPRPRSSRGFIQAFKAEGFVHGEICDQIAGDSRATVDDVGTIPRFNAHSLLEVDETVGAELLARPPTSEMTATNENSAPPSPAGFSPGSAAQRVDRAKRFRNERRKANETNSTATGDEAKACIESFMEAAEAYFLMKMKLMSHERDINFTVTTGIVVQVKSKF
ncbi:unnamed protein product [Phytophthora fragariaefolia]|uniref:Unnamed protein product n=1 Tax=Phytophthora fragariaefolia TaxID=1490495 RepID=A0A9W7D389_9STRA|nr:unnamed protein product [Phytophthora fragariaefolia]